ncbi:sirohydrochlorin chelatase [Alkalicoccus halolimnae]|uniref:Sirohydrochlorin chelatase n=1 Tax=Alkalicoccus halolimnae TaxID=1667239 RepID=A0A5C7FFE9_9BACI|nr:sirohydrochlorin chelatase [Alkalicoccus halolimnae]TXF84620.1 sirohydrochlorin chelatase [Alkalicoccus halolimnae]
MKHILLIGHGSRDEEGIAQFHQMVKKVKEELPYFPVSYCFLELAEPDIQSGVEACVKEGAEEIIALPVILSKANHYKLDIPKELEQAGKKYPETRIHYGEHLGAHPLLVEVLLSSLRLVDQTLVEKNEEVDVILVSQGGSDPEGQEDLHMLAENLSTQIGNTRVHASFMVTADPHLTEGLDKVIEAGSRHVVILPCFLFTGTMYKKIQEMMEGYRDKHTETTFQLADCFGISDLFTEIVVDRVIRELHYLESPPAKVNVS